jgi:hypothetical protein
MLSPGQLRDTYLPTMPEDPAKMAQMVLGGRWCVLACLPCMLMAYIATRQRGVRPIG